MRERIIRRREGFYLELDGERVAGPHADRETLIRERLHALNNQAASAPDTPADPEDRSTNPPSA